jgi:prepilin-type N-terminal cleavage/methylation domain-containing protein
MINLVQSSSKTCRFGQASNRHGFSLIEMLVVVALISILVVMGANAWSGVQRASVLSGAGNRVVELAALAKEAALSRNSITALVTPRDAGKHGGHFFTVLEIGPDRVWKQLTPWAQLPDNIVVDDSESQNQSVLPAADSLVLSLRGETSKPSDLSALVFLPDGRMMSGSEDLRTIRITHADQRRSQEGQGDGLAASNNNYYEIVFSPQTAFFRIRRP